jgi:hypothetical protein
MTDINHTIRGGNPTSHYSVDFLQKMVNRMVTSYHKYGHSKIAVENGVDCLESAAQRVRKYRDDGNTEWLIDAANYLMMEYMHPTHDKAHFDAESRSPGRTLTSGRISTKHSEDL